MTYNTLGFYTKQEYIDLNMSNSCTVFEKIISPLLPLLKKEATSIEGDADTDTLSLYFFSINLLYGVVKMTKSIALLVTEIKTLTEQALDFDLINVSGSMYSEAFLRYAPAIFRRLFYQLLEKRNVMDIAELNALGRFLWFDGSVFPAFKTRHWAHYRKAGNAIKMHLAFELNRMLPVKVITTEANASEKKALLNRLEAGVTYIADRAYMAFPLFYQITSATAFFIIRVKNNLLYTVQEELAFEIPPQWQFYLSAVTDSKISCDNDKRKRVYRLITFVVDSETYFIMTNRFDLKTHDVIMLYAYRWQVELLFRCLKRTFGALHLWAHNPRGIEIHFYIYLIAYVLLLHFKQNCERQKKAALTEENAQKNKADSLYRPQQPSRIPAVCGRVSILNNNLRNCWKLGIHWLTTVKNLMFKPCNLEAILLL